MSRHSSPRLLGKRETGNQGVLCYLEDRRYSCVPAPSMPQVSLAANLLHINASFIMLLPVTEINPKPSAFPVAPTHVTVMGPTEARVGDIVPLTCTTAPSNPPAEIKWMVGGRQVRNATSKTIVSPEGKCCCRYDIIPCLIHFHLCLSSQAVGRPPRTSPPSWSPTSAPWSSSVTD